MVVKKRRFMGNKVQRVAVRLVGGLRILGDRIESRLKS